MAGGSLYQDGGDDAAITDINVTPLVDVMLVLLVIFMVTAGLITSRGVEVSRPTSSAGAPVPGKPILVSVDKAGQLYVEGEAFADHAAATRKLRELAALSDDPKVIIDGDAAAAYSQIMDAISVVKNARIDKIALANAPPGRGASSGTAPAPGGN